LLAASSVYCTPKPGRVGSAANAVALTPVEPLGSPLIAPSVLVPFTLPARPVLPSIGAPVVGSMRKFSPLPVTTLSRSVTGLKSRP
jgi:hypothetical protein